MLKIVKRTITVDGLDKLVYVVYRGKQIECFGTAEDVAQYAFNSGGRLETVSRPYKRRDNAIIKAGSNRPITKISRLLAGYEGR